MDVKEINSPNPEPEKKTPALDSFGRNLTELAKEGKIDPIIGRNKEIERVCQILTRRRKNNPILIGFPGVGKSHIAAGIASKIVNRDIPRILYDKKVIELDMGAIVAGTKYRGQFEERMKVIIEEIKKSNNIILFIDEIHTIIGAGSASGSLDGSNFFKPALASGELQCIGATTLKEYREHIEQDPALARRFQKVLIEPPTINETLEILNQLKGLYEDYHNVKYSDESLKACVHLSDRYITDRFFPDKAIDIMDETGSRVHIKNINVPKNIIDIEDISKKLAIEKEKAIKTQNYEEAGNVRDLERETNKKLKNELQKWEEESKNQRILVTEDHVTEVIAITTGIPIERISTNESKKLLNLDKELMKIIIGQDEAIKSIVKAIKRSKIGMKDKSKPSGIFFFAGVSGIGKSYLATKLSELIYENSLVRLDMSEYEEKHSVSKITGSPPGYVGYNQHNGLTEKIRHKPHSIILLDEIEKAHPDVWDLFLQMFDEGHLTDSSGIKVDFKNTIIIMTSNIGTKELATFGPGIGFKAETTEKNLSTSENISHKILKSLEKTFKPEFINRIDDIIVFNTLSTDDLLKIVDLELKKVQERIEDLGYILKLTKQAKSFIVVEGYDQNKGAREIKRVIQKYVEDPIADLILNNLKKGSNIIGNYKKSKDKIVFKIIEKTN